MISWWFWRRWNIYCPKRRVDHLFDKKDLWKFGLFDWDEAFIPPCSWNPINSGKYVGKHSPKINFLGFEEPRDKE
jgi:hypothetical protein